MTRTASRPALLHVCVQDLHAGKVDFADRVPALIEQVRDRVLAGLLDEQVALAREQAERLRGLGPDATGPRNLWMAGILDDAERDARSHEPGVLLDVALVGAVRKARAAEIVSSETALALARGLELDSWVEALARNRDQEIAADRSLSEKLHALAL